MFKKENLLKYLSCVVISIIFLSVFLFYNISSREADREVLLLNEFTHGNNEDVVEVITEEVDKKNIYVEIKGEVLKPDVYELEEGSIVRDLILISGGLTEDGDLFNINQARELKNGECIVVMSKDEILKLKNGINENNEFLEVSDGFNTKNENDDLININNASKDELKKLNGIGDTLAESIINYREENGKFNTIEDIKNVSRIGDKTFEKFKDKIKV